MSGWRFELVRLAGTKRMFAGLLATACADADAGRSPDSEPPQPGWAYSVGCVPPSEAETARQRHALRSYEVSAQPYDWLAIGATRYLSREQYTQTKPIRPYCLPDGLRNELIVTTTKFGESDGQAPFWMNSSHYYELSFAERLGPGSPKIVKSVAGTAFYGDPYLSNDAPFPDRDLRPKARAILATFGEAAAPYGSDAIDEWNTRTSLGRGAIQVAVAARYPDAAERAAQAIRRILDRNVDVIGAGDTRALIEIAYAFGNIGADANEHLPLLEEALGRTLTQHAPPFGLVPTDAKALCSIFAAIGTPEATKVIEHGLCTDQ